MGAPNPPFSKAVPHWQNQTISTRSARKNWKRRKNRKKSASASWMPKASPNRVRTRAPRVKIPTHLSPAKRFRPPKVPPVFAAPERSPPLPYPDFITAAGTRSGAECDHPECDRLTTAILASAIFQRDVFALETGKVAHLGGDGHHRTFLQLRHVAARRVAHGHGDPVAAGLAGDVQLEEVAALGNVEQRSAHRDIPAFADVADALLGGRRVGLALQRVEEIGRAALCRRSRGGERQRRRQQCR